MAKSARRRSSGRSPALWRTSPATWLASGSELTGFLSDVRAEMRKVVTPSRKEVQATTSVVLVAVFLFGVFFMVTDFVFNRVISQILHKLGGAQ